MKMKNIVIGVIVLLMVYPRSEVTSQVDIKENNPIEVLKQENELLNKELKEAALNHVHKQHQKIVYRTKTIVKKPENIILYVRSADGTISEYKVDSQDGFFIVDESDLMTKKDTAIEFVDTIMKRNFIQKIFRK